MLVPRRRYERRLTVDPKATKSKRLRLEPSLATP
jgi:hypothetical protein